MTRGSGTTGNTQLLRHALRALTETAGVGDGGNPFLARDAVTGRVSLSTLGGSTYDRLQVFRSDDNGLTFGPPVNGTPGWIGADANQDKESITVDNAPGAGQGNV